MYGGFDALFLFFFSTDSILYELLKLLTILVASSSFFISNFESYLYPNKFASQLGNIAFIVQYSSGLNFSISFSLSTINLSATD